MKIFSIVTAFPRDEKDVLIPWIVKLAKLLRRRDVETTIFTSSYCGRKSEIYDGMRVFRFRYFFKKWEKLSHDLSVPEKLKRDKFYFLVLPFFMVFGAISAYFVAKKENFDVIHCHFPFPLALFGIAMQKASKRPMIATCHGSEVNMAKRSPLFRKIFYLMLRSADIITVNSRFMKREVSKIIQNKKIEIIPMGGAVEEPKKIWRGENGEIKILFVGRLIGWKGVNYLVEAFKMLKNGSYRLDVVGDGPEREGLVALSEGFNVKFYGYQKGAALEKLYENADLFVLPSIVDEEGYTEGLGTVLLEAAAYGLPLIGTNVGGIPDIIIHKQTGILVPQRDKEALANAIELLAGDKELRAKLAANATRHLNENFSWETITEKFLELYESLTPR